MKKFFSLSFSILLCIIIATSALCATKYVDVEFDTSGNVFDTLNHAQMVHVTSGLSKIETTDVMHKGITYSTPAFVLSGGTSTTATDYILGTIEALSDGNDYDDFIKDGFSVEVFFRYSGKTPVELNGAIMGNCNASGWALYVNSTAAGNSYNGGVRFIASTNDNGSKGYATLFGTKDAATDELLHVIASYEYNSGDNLSTVKIYENGQYMFSATRTGPFNKHSVGGWNVFAIGANAASNASGTIIYNSMISDCIVVGAGIYEGAVSENEAKTAYLSAIAKLSNGGTDQTTPQTTAPSVLPTTTPSATPSTPPTGDNSSLLFLMSMAALSFVVCYALVAKKIDK